MNNLYFTKTYSYLFALVTLCCFLFISPFLAYAAPDPALTGGSAVTSYSGSAAPITDLQVTGTGNPTVPVKLHVTNGSLSMGTTTGITFTTNTAATLEFSGSLTNVNAALASLTYTRTGTGTDTLEASLVNPGEVFFPGNGHLYEYVSFTSTWTNANTNAATRTKYGATGYLTTITSQSENDFVANRLLDAGWMGASDVSVEGDWKWVTGPESGTSFWSGNSSGSVVSGKYANWNGGEPNDSGGNEDCGQFLSGAGGKWNDLPCTGTTLPGYVVEYGAATPLDVSSVNVSITTQAANNYPNPPTSLGGVSYVDGTLTNSIVTPTLIFTLSDSDLSDTLQYQIQLDDSSNFASPLIDYTSALATQGSVSFTVGQAAGSGTYTVGSGGQMLGNGQYYWRVRTIDNHAAASSYTTANSGSVAFGIIIPTPPFSPTATPKSSASPVGVPCTFTAPLTTPNLFQIDVDNTHAKVYFAPVLGPVSNYYISYGYKSNEERFGTYTKQGNSTGVLSYTINELSPNITYYLKVRAQNDCMPGNWGNEMKVTTTKNGVTNTVRFYKDFFSRVLSVIPQNVQTLGVMTTAANKTSIACDYIVHPGDSLWSIAQSKLGSGGKYSEIMQKNSLSNSLLQVGQKLHVGC